jgi:hypothetical protein
MSVNGVEFVRVNATADGDNTVITGRSNERIVVLGYALNVNAAGVITLQDSAGSPAVFASFELVDGGGVSYAGSPECPAFAVTAALNLEVSNAAGVDTLGHITFVRERTRA